MRMQLKLLFIGLLLPLSMAAQNYRPLEDKEVNILFDYYQQDGNHSPVTGGIGTEKLDCIAPSIVVNVPFDSVNKVGATWGVDYYSSASCNNIDRYLVAGASRSRFVSSASAQDVRNHGDLSYSHKLKNRRKTIGATLGASNEFDVNSFSGGGHYSWTSKSGNTELAIKGSLYYDVWKLIFPTELRKVYSATDPTFTDPLSGKIVGWGHVEDAPTGGSAFSSNREYSTDTRYTTTFTGSYAQVLTKRLQLFVTADLVLQNGILWTPFHRVYFDDDTTKTLPAEGVRNLRYMNHEWLPNHKIKIPIGLRLNYFLLDYITLRIFYRYYWDDFGITSNTVSLETPIKINSWLTISPMYRYYRQTACKYFRPFGEHKLVRDSNGNLMPLTDASGNVITMPNSNSYQSQEQYFTSDYDLSGFTNHKISIAGRISPTFGIKKWKIPPGKWLKRPEGYPIAFKFFEIRLSYYQRSDGMSALTAGMNAGFTF